MQPDCVWKQVEEFVVSETSSARLSQLNMSLFGGAGAVDMGRLHQTAPRHLGPCCLDQTMVQDDGVLDANS